MVCQGLCRRAGAPGTRRLEHFSWLEILTRVKLPAPPSPGWCSFFKKTPAFCRTLLHYQIWMPAPESSRKYCSSFQLRLVMSALGTACTRNKLPFRGTCLSQSSQEKVGQHLVCFFFFSFSTSTLISRALFWAQSQVNLAFAGLYRPACLPAGDHRKWSCTLMQENRAGGPTLVDQLKAEMRTNAHSSGEGVWGEYHFPSLP